MQSIAEQESPQISESPEPAVELINDIDTEQDVIAKVLGENFLDLPQDLYIPPEAMRVFLDTFEGPLDLLLYLIKKQNLDILDIPIAEITRQYVQYIDLMTELKIELAAEYLLMAAMLAEIKSRLLLPRSELESEEEGDDPRAELVRKLQEYERIKKAAEDINEIPRIERDLFTCGASLPKMPDKIMQADVSLDEVIKALRKVFERAKLNTKHKITAEVLSIRDRMTQILSRLQETEFLPFEDLFDRNEGRGGLAVTFIGILELARQSLLEITQAEIMGPVYVRRGQSSDTIDYESIEEEFEHE